MGDKSGIEWTDATWNPVSGCDKVSQGCKNCYAERVFPRVYGRDRVQSESWSPPITRERKFTDIRLHPDRLDMPLRWKRPRRIFVNSMSDLFHKDVPDEFIDQVFAVMALCPQHTFQILTKRPERMLTYLHERYFRVHSAMCAMFKSVGARALNDAAEWQEKHYPDGDGFMRCWPLPNVWLGVSVEDQATADERIPLLLQTPAAVRWISAEPLLGAIDLNQISLPSEYNLSPSLPGKVSALTKDHDDRYYSAPSSLDWVVVGGESGPGARPMHPAWARSLRDQCVAAGVPYFFKQWGEWIPGKKWISDEFDGGAYVEIEGHGITAVTVAHEFDTHWAAVRVGKKKSGRTLDGRTWDECPQSDP